MDKFMYVWSRKITKKKIKNQFEIEKEQNRINRLRM